MREQKNYLVFDEIERRIVLRSLNNLRNSLLSDGRTNTDTVDELLVKFANSKKKKFK